MSFKEWLYDELVNDDVIDSEEVELYELTESFLMDTTELTEDDLEAYRSQFVEHCENKGVTPEWDVDEY